MNEMFLKVISAYICICLSLRSCDTRCLAINRSTWCTCKRVKLPRGIILTLSSPIFIGKRRQAGSFHLDFSFICESSWRSNEIRYIWHNYTVRPARSCKHIDIRAKFFKHLCEHDTFNSADHMWYIFSTKVSLYTQRTTYCKMSM